MTLRSVAWLRDRLSSRRAEPCSASLPTTSAETAAGVPETAAEFGLGRPAECILEVSNDKCNCSSSGSSSLECAVREESAAPSSSSLECAVCEESAAPTPTASKRKSVQQHQQQHQHAVVASSSGTEATERAAASGAVGDWESFLVDGRKRKSAQKQRKDLAEKAPTACSSSSVSGSYATSYSRLLQLPQQRQRRNSNSVSCELAEMWKVAGGKEGFSRQQRSESYCFSNNSSVSGAAMKPTMARFCSTGWSEEQTKTMILVDLLQQQSEAALSVRARKRESLLSSGKSGKSEEAATAARTACIPENARVDGLNLQQHQQRSVAGALGSCTQVSCSCASCLPNDSARLASLHRLQQPLEKRRSDSSSSSSCSSVSDIYFDLILPVPRRRKGVFKRMSEALCAQGSKVNPLNLIRFSERVRKQVGTRFFLLLISVFAGVRGVLYGLSHKALLPYLKNLGQDAGTYQSIDALGTVIWGMMGMVGALSDAVPLGGYQKRYYMVLANLLGVGGVALLAFSPVVVVQKNVWLVGVGTFLLCMQTSTLVLMCSGKYSEMMEKRPDEMKSDVVTFVFACWMVGNLVGSALVGPISDKVGPQPLYYIALPLAAQSLLPIILGFLPEEKQRVRLLSSKLWGHKKFFVMAAAVGFAATGVVVLTILDAGSAATNQQQQAAAEENVSYWMASYCGVASVCLIGLSLCCLPRALAKCNLYLFLWGLVNVSISGALDFFYTAPASCLEDGPHFDYTYYATLTAIVGTTASWSGIWVFHTFLGNWTFRHVFWLTIAVRALAALFDCAIILRINVRYLGISDKFAYLFGDAIVLHLVNTLNHMPGYILTARLCPKGLESTAYALMDGMSHLGWNFSKHLGVLATRLAGISTVQTPQKACNFDNLPLLALITQVALPLLAIPLTFLLLPNQSMSRSLQKSSQVTDTQSGVGGGGGSAVVSVVKDGAEHVAENEQFRDTSSQIKNLFYCSSSGGGEEKEPERKGRQEDADVDLKDCETRLKRDTNNSTGLFDRRSSAGAGGACAGPVGFGVSTGDGEAGGGIEGSSVYALKERGDDGLPDVDSDVFVRVQSSPGISAESDLNSVHVRDEEKEGESTDRRFRDERIVFGTGQTDDAGFATKDESSLFEGEAERKRFELFTKESGFSDKTDLSRKSLKERSFLHEATCSENTRTSLRNVHSWEDAFLDEDNFFSEIKRNPSREEKSPFADNGSRAKNHTFEKKGFLELAVFPANRKFSESGEIKQWCPSADEKLFLSLPFQQQERRHHQQPVGPHRDKLESRELLAENSSVAVSQNLQRQQKQQQQRRQGEQKQALLLQPGVRSNSEEWMSASEGVEGRKPATVAEKKTVGERREVENNSSNNFSLFYTSSAETFTESSLLPKERTKSAAAAAGPFPIDHHQEVVALARQGTSRSRSSSNRKSTTTQQKFTKTEKRRDEQRLLEVPTRAAPGFVKRGAEEKSQQQQLSKAQRRSGSAAEVVEGAAAAAGAVVGKEEGGETCASCEAAALSVGGNAAGLGVCGEDSEGSTRRNRVSGTRDCGDRGTSAAEILLSPMMLPSPVLRRSPSAVSVHSSSLSKSTAAETSHSRQPRNLQLPVAAATAAAVTARESSRFRMLSPLSLRLSESSIAAAADCHQYGQQRSLEESSFPSAYAASFVIQQQQQQEAQQLQAQQQQQQQQSRRRRWGHRLLSALLQRRSSDNVVQRPVATTTEATLPITFSTLNASYQAAGAQCRTAAATS